MGTTVAPAVKAYTPETVSVDIIRDPNFVAPQDPWASFDTLTENQKEDLFYVKQYDDNKWKNEVNHVFENIGNTVLHPIDTVKKEVIEPLEYGVLMPAIIVGGVVLYAMIQHPDATSNVIKVVKTL
jgi:hypothetical protein